MTPIKEDILAKISNEEITPKPKWWFIIGHALLWIFFALTVLVGAIAFSMVLFELFSSDRDLIEFMMSSGITRKQFSLLPYIWIIFGIVTVVISFFFFRSSSRGYRHDPWKMILILLLSSLILGSTLHLVRANEFADKKLQKHPAYREARERIRDEILDPSKGVLVGMPLVDGEDMQIRDRKGNIWDITFSCESQMCEGFSQNIDSRPPRPIMLIGEQETDRTFEVRDVRRPEKESLRQIFEQRKGQNQKPPKPQRQKMPQEFLQ